MLGNATDLKIHIHNLECPPLEIEAPKLPILIVFRRLRNLTANIVGTKQDINNRRTSASARSYRASALTLFSVKLINSFIQSKRHWKQRKIPYMFSQNFVGFGSQAAKMGSSFLSVIRKWRTHSGSLPALANGVTECEFTELCPRCQGKLHLQGDTIKVKFKAKKPSLPRDIFFSSSFLFFLG